MSASDSATNIHTLIRKLRKKLRQIENLEILHRPLTHEEIVKVNSKDDVRAMLQNALDESLEVEDHEEEQITKEALRQPQKPHSEVYEQKGLGDSSKSETDQPCQGVSGELSGQGDGRKSQDINNDSSMPEEGKLLSHQGRGDANKQKSKSKKKKPGLSESYCRLSYLDGHNDLVTALTVVGDRVVTARDTTLKYWDVSTGQEIHSYGSHTDIVTSLIVLDSAKDVTLPEDDKLLISGSLDCTFNLWALNAGYLLKSVYTYNPVVRLAYCVTSSRLITGSDGGKLELWNLASGENVFSARVHNAPVTGLKVSENTVYSCASDGIIRIHQVTDSDQLTCVFVSENLKTPSGDPVIARSIRSLALCSDLLVFGDDTRNLKVLDWRKGVVRKLANHLDNFTFTDALCCHGDLLLSSSYDLDDALGHINVRSSKTLEYLATFANMDSERILCLDFGYMSPDRLFVVSGGIDVLVWEVLPAGTDSCSPEQDTTDEDIFKLKFIPALAGQAVDSETESSDVDTDDSDIQKWSKVTEKLKLKESPKGWVSSWCSVL